MSTLWCVIYSTFLPVRPLFFICQFENITQNRQKQLLLFPLQKLHLVSFLHYLLWNSKIRLNDSTDFGLDCFHLENDLIIIFDAELNFQVHFL